MRKVWLPLIFSVAVIGLGVWLTDSSYNNSLNLKHFAQVLGIERWLPYTSLGGSYQTLVVPANDNFVDTITVNLDTPVNTSNVDATMEGGENSWSNLGSSIWWTYHTLSASSLTISLCGSDFDTILAVYTDNVLPVDETNWVAGNDDSCDAQSEVTFETVADTDYKIQVGGYMGGQGNIILTLTETLLPPPSDNFADAANVSIGDSIQIYSLASATTEAGEPILVQGKYPVTNSVWYSLTSTETKDVTIDTCSNDTETMLAVFTGDTIGSLVVIDDNNYGCDYGGGANKGARVYFHALIGVTYKIQLSIYDNQSSGSVDMYIIENTEPTPTPPVNDDFANSIGLTIDDLLPVTSEYNRIEYQGPIGATMESGEPNNGGAYKHSIWYSWTNNDSTREVWVDTCAYGGPSFLELDTILGVYTGSSIGTMSLVAENDDWGTPENPNWDCNWDSITSFVLFTAQNGETYHFRIVDLSNINITGMITLRTKPTVVATAPDVPDGGLWCENHGGIARKLPYRIDDHDWAACWSWCSANMTNDMQICQMNGDGGRNCWLNYTPAGGMDNCYWVQGVYGPETWPKGSYWGEITGYLMYLPSDLNGYLITNENINISINKQKNDKTIMLKDADNGARLIDVMASFTQDLDWTSVDGNSDLVRGKAFMYNLSIAPQAGSTYSLYVPIPGNKESTQVVICPDSITSDAISRNCPNVQTRTLGDAGTDIVTVNSQSYWKLDNIQSTGDTGAYSYTTTGLQVDLPSTTTYPGVPFNFTINALDSNSEVDAGYFGTAGFTTDAPGATLPDNYTFIDASLGTHNFNVTFTQLGTYTITVTDTTDVGLTSTSVQIEVLDATPTPIPTITPTQIPGVTETSAPTVTPTPTVTVVPTITITPTVVLTPTVIPTTLEITEIQITQIVNGVQICWQTTWPATGYVKYGISSGVFIFNTIMETEAFANHCQALTVSSNNADYYFEIVSIDANNKQAQYTGAFQVIKAVDILPQTGVTSCRIDPPQISGDTNNGYQISFTTDNNEQVVCNLSLGTDINNLKTDGLSIQRGVDNFTAKILASALPKTNTLQYQIVCKNISKECSYTNKIDLNWPSKSNQGENLLAILLGSGASNITTPLGEIAVSPVAKTAVVGMVGLAAATFAFTNPQMFYVGLIWVYRRSKKNRFGLVYDTDTKQVVPFAVIRLLDIVTNKVVVQTVTDLQGRYHLLAPAGNYNLEVSQDIYTTYRLPITLSGYDLQVTANIGLSKNNLSPGKKLQLRKLLQKLNKYIFALGFGFSLLMLILNFYIVNVIIIVIYMFQMFLLALQRPPRNWGRVVEAVTGKELKGAFISILDLVEQRQIDIQISDAQGRFGLILEKQEYLLKVNLSGYKPKKINKPWEIIVLPGGDLTYVIPQGEVSNLDVEMEILPT